LRLSVSAILTRSSEKLEIHTDDIKLTVDQAVSCGLILNELVTNSLKYAFPSGKGGRIGIHARYNEDNTWIELEVFDNGIGLPDDLDHRRTSTLGMRIISLLIENQLEGAWHMSNSNGARFFIKWPLG